MLALGSEPKMQYNVNAPHSPGAIILLPQATALYKHIIVGPEDMRKHLLPSQAPCTSTSNC